jgi:hypothetical protein
MNQRIWSEGNNPVLDNIIMLLSVHICHHQWQQQTGLVERDLGQIHLKVS